MDGMPAGSMTPCRDKQIEEKNMKIWFTISVKLNSNWDLDLPTPQDDDSPDKREPSTEQRIVTRIKGLTWRDLIDPLIQRFDAEAQILYTGWVNKPKGERGVVPERTRRSKRSITPGEREQLYERLLSILNEKWSAMTPSKQKALAPTDPNTSIGSFDDRPLPAPMFKASTDFKRPYDQTTSTATYKKPRLPLTRPSISFPSASRLGRSGSSVSIAPSVVDSVFSTKNRSKESLDMSTQESVTTEPSTQDFEVGVDMRYRDTTTYDTSFEGKIISSSDYEAGSSFDQALASFTNGQGIVGVAPSDPVVDDELSQDLLGQAAIEDDSEDCEVSEFGEAELKERLKSIFPQLPVSLSNSPFCVAYETTRVFLHTGVPLHEIVTAPPVNYDAFWKSLRSLPILQGKVFPERCNHDAWEAALGDFERGAYSVFMSGSFHYTDSLATEGSLFRLNLNALRLDSSHRSGRRFGHDRFLEIDLPNLTGRQIPKSLQMVGKNGPEVIVDWLVDGDHQFLGRTWKPFHLKPQKRKERKEQLADEATPKQRLIFFAVDGTDFKVGSIPDVVTKSSPNVKISIESLLNRIRPTRKNTHQSYLKLFSRTSLALSRNTPTVVLQRSQIRDRDDLTFEGEVMTDGAGRISPSLAVRVAQSLGLLYCPSGFQARIGEAKGFWSVDWTERSNAEWVEVMKSQSKWDRSTKVNGESDHPSHRTFEVIKTSGPLKSADLNLQLLPVLIDRSKSSEGMKDAIAKLLVDGLDREVDNARNAIDSPAAFLKWVREMKSNTAERLRSQKIVYRGGLPLVSEERLGRFIEAGFKPREQLFMKRLTYTLFKNKCIELKSRLNITVGKSTYVYMVPDFSGVLEPDEVYMDFSAFTDSVTGFSGPPMREVELLVARSPAHYASDVQKVKAVVKSELIGYKDVIIFSVKGTPSLASKLSGGDYDGDIAWVCWEPSLVDNFENAPVPVCPELGNYLRYDKRTYDELVFEQPSPVSTFLKKSFAFSMTPSMLGICTNFKEKVCYTQKSISTPESVFLSTLLSSLVDQAKQAIIFTDDDWTRVKHEIVKVTPVLPKYKSGEIDPRSDNVIDHLVYIADKTIESKLTDFHGSFPDPPSWDDDLAALYKSTRTSAERSPVLSSLLDDLDSDLLNLKTGWAKSMSKGGDDRSDETKSEFLPTVDEHYTNFLAILPHSMDSTAARLLLPKNLPEDETPWALLRASALFASYSKYKDVKSLVWWMAGRQLFHLKAKSKGESIAMTPSIHITLKTDASFLRKMMSGVDSSWETPTNQEELEELHAEDD